MQEAYIIACARSPMARALKGFFAFTRIDDIAAAVVKALIGRVKGLDTALIEDVLVGCAMPEGEQGFNVARQISFLAGIPFSATAVTINRFCGSSLEAINIAAMAVAFGNGELFLAGGIESMSHVPMGGFNPSLNEKLMRKDMPDAYIAVGLTAENLAREYGITREEQDRFALASHMKACAAHGRGKFTAEIIPVIAITRDGKEMKVDADECPRADTSLEALSRLAPSFLEGGSVTAGNSSPLTDGAAFVLVASKRMAKKISVKPLVKIRAMATAGCDPAVMGIGPVFSVPKALSRAGMKLKHIDLIELNEAFAAQSLAVVKKLSIDEKKLNVHGGAIALGHPLGMSGARIMTTLINAMGDLDAGTGMATMCIGGGQGIATVVEKV